MHNGDKIGGARAVDKEEQTKDRAKDKDEKVDKPRRERSHTRDRDRDRNDKDKSSANLKDQDRDRDRSRDEDRDRSRHKDKDDKDREREKEKEKSKDRDKQRDKEKEKEFESNARPSKDKDKDKHKDKDKDKDKDRDSKERDEEKERKKKKASSMTRLEARKERKKALSFKIMNSSTTLAHSKSQMLSNYDYSSSPSPSPSPTPRSPSPAGSPTSSPPASPHIVASPTPSSSIPHTLSAIPSHLLSEPQSIAAVARKPSSSRLDFARLNQQQKKTGDLSSDTLLKSFSITQNAPFSKHLKGDAPIFLKAFGLWKDLSATPGGEYRQRSYSTFSMKDLPLSDFAMRTVAAIEAPPTEQEQKDAIADFEDWITSWVTKTTHKHLADHLSINEVILKRISSGNLSTLSLRELPIIRSTLRKLNTYFRPDDEDSEYARFLTQSVSEQVGIAAAIEGMNNRRTGPVRVSATYDKLPLQLIEVYRKSCEVALEEIRMKEPGRYIDGTCKEKLSSWWLSVIQDRVDHFLTQLGYDFLTVPQDYTMTPPRSIRRVRGNLSLITRCLSLPSDDPTASPDGSTSRSTSPDRRKDSIDSSTGMESPTADRPNPQERPSSQASDRPLGLSSGSRTGTWGRSSMKLRAAVSEQSISAFLNESSNSVTSSGGLTNSSMTSSGSIVGSISSGLSVNKPMGSIVRNHRESLLQLVDELSEQIYGVIGEFIEEALIVLEDGLILYMEENGVKTEYDDKIFNKGDREILELDAADKILRKCIVHDLAKSEDVEKPLEHEESKFLLRYRNKETETLANLNNLAKDIRYLYRMMELEDETKITARLMDAVPVTGLILARMCTLENETRTVLELWEERAIEEAQQKCESPRGGQYTGFKKFKEGGGEGNILRMLNDGANMQRHGKRRILTTAVHVHVPSTLDFLVFSTTDAAHSRVTKQIPILNLKSVELGKTPAFCFHAVDSCCFFIPLQKGNTLNLETKSPLERDKWVAAFKWLLATRDAREAALGGGGT